MTSHSTGSGIFAAQLRAFADKTKENIEDVTRVILIKIGESLITLSPVGNAEIWAANAVEAQYNKEVGDLNAELRKNPDNLNKKGLFKPGIKINDGMDLVAGKGYVGGRFRANWMFSINTPDTTTTDTIDKSGGVSMARIREGAIEFPIGETAYITNSLPYAIPLEFGHSTQAPHGMVRVTLVEFERIVTEAIRSNRA